MQVSEFTTFISNACARRPMTVATLAQRLVVDAGELLNIINGKVPAPAKIVKGIAAELDIDPRYLAELAAKLGPQ